MADEKFPQYLSRNQAARLANIPVKLLDRLRQKGVGPKFLRLSHRCVRYERGDLLKWLNMQKEETEK